MAKHRAANLNGNSPIKHVYKVTDQFTLVIAGNNVQSNGNSSLKLDRNGPRLHSFPLPLVFVPNSHSPRGRSRDYVENRNAYYEFLFRNPIIVIFESSSFRIFIENAIRSQPWISLRFITREINSHRRTSFSYAWRARAYSRSIIQELMRCLTRPRLSRKKMKTNV